MSVVGYFHSNSTHFAIGLKPLSNTCHSVDVCNRRRARAERALLDVSIALLKQPSTVTSMYTVRFVGYCPGMISSSVFDLSHPVSTGIESGMLAVCSSLMNYGGVRARFIQFRTHPYFRERQKLSPSFLRPFDIYHLFWGTVAPLGRGFHEKDDDLL